MKTEWIQREYSRCLARLGTLMIVMLVVNMLISPPSVSAADGKRVAFVVGIGTYDALPVNEQLKNALNDADDVSTKLKEMGFDVVVVEHNLKRSDFNKQYDDILSGLTEEDTFVLFFSGHGVQIEGQNYLLPRDSPYKKYGRPGHLAKEAISLNDLVNDLTTGDRPHPKRSVLILDACRKDPFIPEGYKALGASGGLAKMEATGTFIIFAAANNRIALDRLPDNDTDKNSVFTRVLLTLMGRTDLTIQKLSIELKDKVAQLAQKSGYDQQPAYYDGIRGEFCLPGCSDKVPDQARDAAVAKSHQLAALAREEKSGRFDLALLLSLAAFRIDSNVITRRSIFELLQYPAHRFTNLWGGLREINDLAFSPDGKLLVAAGPDGDLMRWTVSDPLTAGVRIPGHNWPVKTVRFALERKIAVSAGSDNKIVIWDFGKESPYLKDLVSNEQHLMAAVLSPDGQRVATVNFNRILTVYDVDSQRPIAIKTVTDPGEGPFITLAYSPDGRLLATASGNGRIRLWETTNFNQYGDILEVGENVQSVAFSLNSSLLGVGTYSGNIHLWGLSGAVQKPKVLRGHASSVQSIAFSNDGKLLASASLDNSIRLWDVSASGPLDGFESLEHRSVRALALDPSGRWLASGSSEGELRIWDLNTRTGIGEVITNSPKTITALAVSSDGLTLAAGGNPNGSINLWNLPSRTPQSSLKVHNFNRYAQYLRFARDDQEIVSSDQYHEVCVTQITSVRKNCTSMKGKLGEGEAIFPSPDENILVTRSHEGVVRLWSSRNFTPIGKPLAERLNASASHRLGFSSDGQTIAGPCGLPSTALCLIDIGSPLTPRVKVVADKSGVGDVAFRWDGKMIATAGGERLIWLWDLTPEPRKHLEPLRWHIGAIRDLMFSPNGKLLSSVAYSDGRIRLWDVEKSGVFDTVLKGNRTTVTAMAFSGDSTILASGADDGLIVLWDLSETSWRERACRMANRNLTKEEWNNYVGDGMPFELLCQL